MLMFMWINGDNYRLMDPDLHKLPNTLWFIQGNCLCNGEHTAIVSNDQPKDAYLLRADI